ncbi:hypothetical protein BDV95DRAFT_609224 [Massariosphaeria phaeospora]|uniref:Uncharacterized protein n=1 Tax=Massariosphaeria phaeospora TaxID=100035 RepID=A0A7C8I473_9PLEO|nr:hypothetical protein BDV95DRAFT_609224 [Massariosphaeria phaeospora]
MAPIELQDQPVQGSDAEKEEVREKSGVVLNPNAPDQSGRYGKLDVVHMAMIANGVRTKGTFSVSKARRHSSGAFYEYQLQDGYGNPYKNGAWVREKDLRLEQKHS